MGREWRGVSSDGVLRGVACMCLDVWKLHGPVSDGVYGVWFGKA